MGILAVMLFGICGLLLTYWWREGGNMGCWEVGYAEVGSKEQKMN